MALNQPVVKHLSCTATWVRQHRNPQGYEICIFKEKHTHTVALREIKLFCMGKYLLFRQTSCIFQKRYSCLNRCSWCSNIARLWQKQKNCKPNKQCTVCWNVEGNLAPAYSMLKHNLFGNETAFPISEQLFYLVMIPSSWWSPANLISTNTASNTGLQPVAETLDG